MSSTPSRNAPTVTLSATEIYNHLTMWDELSFDDKRQTVDQLIRVIYATNDSIKIEWRI